MKIIKLFVLAVLLCFCLFMAFFSKENTINGIFLFFAFLLLVTIFSLSSTFNTSLFAVRNRSIEESKNSIIDLLNLTKNHIKIYTGELRENVYDDEVMELFFDKIHKLQLENKDFSADIILAYQRFDLDKMNVKFIKKAINDPAVNVYKATKILGPHFVVSDDLHTRVEEIHHFASDDRIARLYFFSPYLSRHYSKKFEKIKKNSNIIRNVNDLNTLATIDDQKWSSFLSEELTG